MRALAIALLLVDCESKPARLSPILPLPPDTTYIGSEIRRLQAEFVHEQTMIQIDQNHADLLLLICERLSHGVFAGGGERHYCVRGGEVLFEGPTGRELFWWRMQAVRAPARTRKKPAADPWQSYAP